MRHPTRNGVAVLGGVALAYFAVAKLGLSFAEGHEIVSAVWPPSGLALAAVVLLGPRVAPAIFLGALVANATGDSTLPAAAGIASGNALAALLGAALLARVRFEPTLQRVRDVVALGILGAVVSTALNATIGTAVLLASHVIDADRLWPVWRVWWLGDLTGVLLVAPPLLLLGAGGDPRPRLREAGTVLGALVISAAAVALTANDMGPFAGGAPDMDLLHAQVLVGLVAMTGLLVSAMRTEWRQTEAAFGRLEESERALAEAQRLAHIGSFEWDARADRVTWSEELFRIFGIDPRDFDGRYETYLDSVHPEDRPRAIETIRAALGTTRPFLFEHRIVQPDGTVRTLESRGRALVGADGVVHKLLGTAQDVTERRETERELEHQALHDQLTNLPNRTLFLDRLQHALTRSRRSGSSLAVYFCDVDDFKNVNDTLGHEAGDELLLALPPRLSEALRAGDTVARFGGDEFVVLCEDLASEAEAIAIAERIPEAFRLPFELEGFPHHLTVSVGVVFVRRGAANATELLRDADAAMHGAKSAGKNRFEVFDTRLRASLVARLQTEADLRRAIETDELRLRYQPLMSLRSGAFVGAEALVRWEHPERGLLSPAEFIPIAEDSGLIVPLGAWVLAEACRQAAAWDGEQRVAVNLSPRQLTHSDVPALLERALVETGVDPSQIELEITENVLMEQSSDALVPLRRLKQMGVRVVLDDFGTGWSSLGYLQRFPIDGLKIDREFIDGLGVETGDTAIVSAVLSLARALELEVVAEGVETERQLEWLRERGCTYAQGYLLGRPMAAAQLEEDPRWHAGGVAFGRHR
jgi:diguanylate cyclase (GGDEF)-like protein/PAS domain S-box-containing protein